MSGIYIHIPFCKQACHYCDFHFSTNLSLVEKMVAMICKELELRKNFLPAGAPIQTIYFGGGTPSILKASHLDQILHTIYKFYNTDIKELTLEANPDDLSSEKLLDWKSMDFDRLSIGVQSFDQKILAYYNRAHNALESFQAIDKAKKADFEKLSIDLIYGFPSEDHGIWEKDLFTALEMDPGHISSYALTVEPKTALGKWTQLGEFKEADEDYVAEQFEHLMESCQQSGYIQYEISNFGKPGHFALHNTNYWKNTAYLGIGPGAHSYDGKHRGSNISNNVAYIKKMSENTPPYHIEEMSGLDICNEYILTSLRTIWGTDLKYIEKTFQVSLDQIHRQMMDSLLQEKMVQIKEGFLFLEPKGKLLADSIAASLFVH
ncbi:radical SAM family heme chaperone HemW [Indibacter alkaliphilus]|uniref:radical SAM family heme chaperone HemW n=1 Tax=Indibacter alkaliphilus TaxID=579922 RepID=UPI00058FD7F3|nr:radical SAM family heme chaperone HemW [Indibacter alkaliphilus]